MSTNQGLRQQSVRDVTGTTLTYEGDWFALWDAQGIPGVTFNERMLAWCNERLGASYVNLNDAMNAFAVSQGFYNWSAMGTFDAGGSITFDFTGGTLPDGATLQRASTGTRFNASGVLVSMPIDQARFDYSFDGSVWSFAGLLVEPQRTNLIRSSGDITAGLWQEQNGTLSQNVGTGPDGNNGADKWTPSTGNNAFHLFQTWWQSANGFTPTVGKQYCSSWFLKPDGYSFGYFAYNNTFSGGTYDVFANLGTGAFGNRGAGIGAGDCTSQNVSAGWWRFNVRWPAKASPSAFDSMQGVKVVPSMNTDSAFAGNGTSGIQVWGPQCEEGAFSSSYIPNASTSNAATRAADVLTLDIEDGDYNIEVVTPNGTFSTASPVTVSGGAYEFDWADFTGASTERHLRSLTATAA